MSPSSAGCPRRRGPPRGDRAGGATRRTAERVRLGFTWFDGQWTTDHMRRPLRLGPSIFVRLLANPATGGSMNTRILLIASSLILGLAGAVASFAPAELLAALKVAVVTPLPVIVQILGALYLAFALANWTAKGSLMGGIYARPLALGNFMHFTVGALALLKYQLAAGFQGSLAISLACYGIFALGFGAVVLGGGGVTRVNEDARP